MLNAKGLFEKKLMFHLLLFFCFGKYNFSLNAFWTPPLIFKLFNLFVFLKIYVYAWIESSIVTFRVFVSNHLCPFIFPEYGVTLAADIESDTSGDFRRLLLHQLNAKRDETKGIDINLEMARQDAQELYRVSLTLDVIYLLTYEVYLA